MENVKSRIFKVTLLVFALLIIAVLAMPALAQNVPCFFSLGGAKFTAGVYRSSICEWEMQSTTVLDIQSGVTETHANDPTFSGNPTFSGSPSYSGAVDFTFVQGIDAGAVGDSVEVAFTSPVDTAGSNTHNAYTVDLVIGNATGGTNNVRGLQIDSITGDAQVIETAINIESGWDVGLAVDAPADFTYIQAIDAGATGDALEITYTTPIDTAGSNTHNALTVDLAIGNATGGTNNVRGLQIDSVTGDAEVIETAINVEAGWDVGLSVVPPADFSFVQGIDAGATGDSLEVAFTSPIDTAGTNIHNAFTVDLTIGNATGGTNSVRGLQIDSIVEDTQVTETAINVEGGWDIGLAVDSPSDFTYVQGIDAGATGDTLEIAFTSPVDTTGTNTHNAFVVDLAIGNSTAGTNNVVAVQIDAITGDAQVVETAINIGDEWDIAIDTGLPVVASAMYWFDDFIGDTVLAQYTEASGTDGQALQTIVEEQFGVYQLTSGDAGVNTAGDAEQVSLSLEWQADQGSLIFETRLHIDTSIANTELCVGLTDNVGLELPFTNAADTITAVANDSVAFCYDTNATTDEWWSLGVAGTTKATGNAATGTAPTADVYQTLRIEIDDGGADCRFYIDGALAGTLTANCITITVPLAPVIVISSAQTAVSSVVDVDYILVGAARD